MRLSFNDNTTGVPQGEIGNRVRIVHIQHRQVRGQGGVMGRVGCDGDDVVLMPEQRVLADAGAIDLDADFSHLRQFRVI
ncbi:hypothetical protein, partial [Komagataeibacter europaeus]|uniref:hypothetical protein n=1 Tax=Komagataeibacter europaeus TaxID=33995 RepID=UPI000AF8D1B7